MSFGESRVERLEHAQFRQQRLAIVHIQLVFARPMESLAGQNLQTFQVNPMPFVELDVALREIVADNTDQLDRAEKTGRDRRMTGRAAKKAWVFSLRSPDGIQRGRTDNQHTHILKVKMSREHGEIGASRQALESDFRRDGA